MARDIEEFLRKAAERRAKQKNAQNRPARQRPPEPEIVDDIEIIEPEPATRIQSNVKNQIAERKLAQRREAERRRAEAKRKQSVKPRAQQEPKKRTRPLGSRIASVHDEIEAHIHEHLDHDITKIDDTPTITDDPSPAIFGKRTGSAAKIREMLKNPEDVGNAILLAEILKRPDFD